MNRISYIIICTLFLPLLAVTYGCGSEEAEKVRCDSVYSAENINTICLTEPEKALALLDTAEQHKLMSDLEIIRLRCLVYHNGLSDYKKALQYGLKAYHMPDARTNAENFLNLVDLIADEYYQNGDYSQSIRYCAEGIKTAQDSVVPSSEADFNVTLGMNLLELDRPEEAYSYFNKGTDILEKESRKSDIYMATDDYVYALGIIANALCDQGRIDESLAFLPRCIEAIDSLETKRFLPDGLVDMRRASGYAMFAYLSALKGDTEKARKMYDKLCSTKISKSFGSSSQLHVPYLLASKNYSEALRYLKEEKEYWQTCADTVSYEYINGHLKRELEAYEGLGNIHMAVRVLKTIQELGDTLRKRDRQEKALELAEIYKTNEQAAQIERQSASILMHNIIIGACVIFFIFIAIFIARILNFNRTISTKNRTMVKTVEELIGYKDKVLALQEENIRLKKTNFPQAKILPAEVFTNTQSSQNVYDEETDTSPNNTIELTKSDRQLFEHMNFEVLNRRLYLDPVFSKASLLAEFHIPAYKFSAMFKEYAGCSFSQYIHNCRLDYAVRLMQENPSWSQEAIAKAACMSTSSFYHQFKKKFGMRPSDFKAGETSNSSNEE